MKPTARGLGAAAAAAVLLTGCAAGADPRPAATVAESALTAVAQAAQGTRGIIDPAVVEVLTDPTKAKKAALDAGRPEVAWDQHCITWSLPAADTDARAWAHDVAGTWLEHHDAKCPDQIAHPGYYAETFTAASPGALVITLDDEALADYYVNPHSDRGLQDFGFRIMSATRETHPELETVTVTVEGTDRTWTTTTAEHDGGRFTTPLPPHVQG